MKLTTIKEVFSNIKDHQNALTQIIIDGKNNQEKVEQIREYIKNHLSQGVQINQEQPRQTFEYKASKNNFSDSEPELTSVTVNNWWRGEFFKALDAFFKYTQPSDTTDLSNSFKAIEALDAYDKVWTFFDQNPGLTNYQDLANKILETYTQNEIKPPNHKPADPEAERRRAGRKLNALYDLFSIGIGNEDINDVFKLVYFKARDNRENKYTKLAQQVLLNEDINNKAKIKYLKLLTSKKESFEDTEQKILRAFNQTKLTNSHKTILKEFDYQNVVEGEALTEVKDINIIHNEIARPTAYRGETVAGIFPVANFITWEELPKDEFAKFYSDSGNAVGVKPNPLASIKTSPRSGFKDYEHDTQCLYLKADQNCSRRHIALEVDNKQNIWLRRTSERFNVDVFRNIKDTLIKVPAYEDKKLKLEPGDIFHVGNIEFELSKHGQLTLRKLKIGFEGLENLAKQKHSIEKQDIYAKGAPEYKLNTEKGKFRDMELISTRSFKEKLSDNKQKIFDAVAGILGAKEFIDISSIIYNAANPNSA